MVKCESKAGWKRMTNLYLAETVFFCCNKFCSIFQIWNKFSLHALRKRNWTKRRFWHNSFSLNHYLFFPLPFLSLLFLFYLFRLTALGSIVCRAFALDLPQYLSFEATLPQRVDTLILLPYTVIKLVLCVVDTFVWCWELLFLEMQYSFVKTKTKKKEIWWHVSTVCWNLAWGVILPLRLFEVNIWYIFWIRNASPLLTWKF